MVDESQEYAKNRTLERKKHFKALSQKIEKRWQGKTNQILSQEEIDASCF